MLIVAIPKSASTSLSSTLHKYHKTIKCTQSFKFKTNPQPTGCKFLLHKKHSDCRELTRNEISLFSTPSYIHKQHIFPSRNNINLVRKFKKVILLRTPEDIVLAYRRALRKGLVKGHKYFQKAQSEDEWVKIAKDCGLMDDLEMFYNKWKAESERDPKTHLLIYYQDLINDTKNTINKIENFFGLSVTQNVILAKKRFTGE